MPRGGKASVVLMLTTALQQDERELSMLYTLYDALAIVQSTLEQPADSRIAHRSHAAIECV